MINWKEDFTLNRWYKLLKDLTIPVVIGLVAYFGTQAISDNEQKIKLLEIFNEKIMGTSEEKRYAIDMINSMDEDLASRLRKIIDKEEFELWLKELSSGEGSVRIEAVNKLVDLHKIDPDRVIQRILEKIPKDKNEWPPMISIVSVFYYIEDWEGTQEQFDKFKTLKESPYYGKEGNNIKKYFDSAESRFRLKKE